MGINVDDIFGEDDGAELVEVELLVQQAGGVEAYVEELGAEVDPGDEDTAAIKWVADGATTLGEAATMLETFARDLRARESEGWQLEQPVDGGFCLMSREHPEG